MHYKNISEEELKSRVREDFFQKFDYKPQIGNIDFCIQPKNAHAQPELFGEYSILWAEAKRGTKDIFQMFAHVCSINIK